MTAIKVEYVDHLGDDLRVVNAARVSFDKQSEYEDLCTCGNTEASFGFPCTHGGCNFQEVLKPQDARLISYLAKHNHWTPFAHCQITLRETVPIFVARQRFKHMVGFTYNEVSRRYVDSDPEFFEPEVWRKKAENVKQGSSEEPVETLTFYTGHLDPDFRVREVLVSSEVAGHHRACLKLYRTMLRDGVCPEQARMVLPQSMMTSYYVTGSLAAFARAYKQRSDSHSQKEIQELAEGWNKVIRPLFPESWLSLTTTHV